MYVGLVLWLLCTYSQLTRIYTLKPAVWIIAAKHEISSIMVCFQMWRDVDKDCERSNPRWPPVHWVPMFKICYFGIKTGRTRAQAKPMYLARYIFVCSLSCLFSRVSACWRAAWRADMACTSYEEFLPIGKLPDVLTWLAAFPASSSLVNKLPDMLT